MMKANIRVRGELAYRILKNYTRLQEKEYRPEFIFHQTEAGYGWPGDWEGRTILALVLMEKLTGAEAAYLEDMLQGIKKQLEPYGYLGVPTLEQDRIDEQQLAGHNWLLRGLLERSVCDKRPFIKEMITRIVENLYLPITGAYKRYPLGGCRTHIGEAMGSLQADAVNGWLLSTDIGCAYISLDALSQYYQLYRDKRILPLLTEMAETFMKIDFLGESLQTHASLSAARGILRLYQETGGKEYLDFVVEFFALYRREAMTENYANYNWFGRPAWTEGCAIVDSYMLSVELFKQTGDGAYLEWANKIFYNALGHAQRNNGGFGCDRCVVAGGENEQLYVEERYYEASWCCTMRGAEGLSYAVYHAFLPEACGGVFTNYAAGSYDLEHFEFTVDTEYPYDGRIKIHFLRCPENSQIKCYIPASVSLEQVQVSINDKLKPWKMEDQMLVVELPGPCEFLLQLPLSLHSMKSLHPSEKKSCWYGVLQLGCDAKADFVLENLDQWAYNENRYFTFQDHVLFPINQSIYVTREELLERSIKVLFSSREEKE